ncbi:Rieske 2Fe-2S domain-containing protein [Altererythrobacter salegens]|uniref:Rieske 2Fe-2S domain-containing protein n=1 Tax=Croceibacterium salegens TaxID=1737568 RepID=A0A6I4SR51_9SPHN|nr:Rieske 2Fe-2S domain-containing protein [Croceibacterium salegens]MXO58315.1 Rieske 2Fe-2S domain-containing protein [Croceibacterium salegens]
MATAPKDPAPTIPQGTAYGRGAQHAHDDLTRVGPGTPMGELMRRYWQPVLASRNVTTRPTEVRILGEDLIIFRDGEGRPGLLYPRCMHRGTSLFWGHVEADGIRCCYHGWKFAVDGVCLEQPCEPNPHACRPEHRQPWYPVRERYGLVWAYMGPPERMPALPRFDSMEPLEDGETYMAFDNSLGSHGDFKGPEVVPYSWLHMNDNVMDPFHVQVLHTTFSGTQFVREFEVMPRVEFDEIEAGVIYQAHRDLADGRHVNRVSTWMMPNVMFVPDVAMRPGRPNGIGMSVPVDDEHSRILMAMRVPADARDRPMRGLEAENFKPWHLRTIEERQDQPGDYEAQAGQGAISLHSEEHLVTSDKGIGMQRRMLRRALETVAAGGDPPGVSFDEDAVVRVPSGNFFG